MFPPNPIRLNCDLGEGFGPWCMGEDAAIMPLIDQANIACGFHAGDPLTMRRTIRLALEHGVSMGAHPGYPDLVGFGRRAMAVERTELIALVRYQVGALMALACAEGGTVDYVKPHGALYHAMMAQPEILEAVLEAVAGLKSGLALMVQALADNSATLALAARFDVPLIFEAFADRRYLADGHLAPRNLPGAVHEDEASIVQQALSLARGEPLRLDEGASLQLRADSLCVHGDTLQALAAVCAIRAALGPRV